jgi:hypothetical protein
MIGTDCIGSCKSNYHVIYHTITATSLSPGSPVSAINKTDRNDITEILLKVALNTIKQTNKQTNKQTTLVLFST